MRLVEHDLEADERMRFGSFGLARGRTREWSY